MNRIILASHSGLARGMCDTAQFFGMGDGVEVLEQTALESGFEQRARALLERHSGDNCIVFTDIIGGSVNQTFTKLLTEYSFHLVSGMNLGMVLECGAESGAIDSDFIRDIVAASAEQTCYMNDRLSVLLQSSDEDD